MGRAILIICAGVLVSLGFISLGTNQQARQVFSGTAGYAEIVQAKYAAHTGIQLAMQEINDVKALDDGTEWWDNHYSESTAWTKDINGSNVKVYVDTIFVAPDADDYWKPDIIRVISEASYHEPFSGNEKSTRIVSVYNTNAVGDYVPGFKGALTFATNQVIPQFNDSVSVSGNDASGTCPDLPAITIRSDIDPETEQDITTQMSKLKTAEGGLQSDADLRYEPTNEMTSRLAVSDEAIFLPATYKGSMGTSTNPGVFFVENDVMITGGITEGYGILIIRADGNMTYMDETGTEVDISDKLTFNGLVIFENAFRFEGRGTPSINGSVLVGHTSDYLETIPSDEMVIKLNGFLNLQYDCKGEDYAKMAAALIIDQRRFRRLSTFE